MAVDADRGTDAHRCRDDLPHPARQHAAVGVAQHDRLGARLRRRADHLEGVRPVEPVTVEEVLGVDEHPHPLRAQVGDRVTQHLEVLLEGGPQCLPYVTHVALRDQGRHGGAGVAQRADQRVVRRLHPDSAGHPEGHQFGVAQRELTGGGPSEELGVLRVRPRPTALDEPHSEVVEVGGDPELVVDRELHALLLRTVAEGDVVDLEGPGWGGSRGNHGARSSGSVGAGPSVGGAGSGSRGGEWGARGGDHGGTARGQQSGQQKTSCAWTGGTARRGRRGSDALVNNERAVRHVRDSARALPAAPALSHKVRSDVRGTSAIRGCARNEGPDDAGGTGPLGDPVPPAVRRSAAVPSALQPAVSNSASADRSFSGPVGSEPGLGGPARETDLSRPGASSRGCRPPGRTGCRAGARGYPW
ncbi:hypothetical protein SDC9_85984 [bioreactor metagenome]|uniref:Uncharacterized protein n=1 Tax=bioreactor metagenome TaxID=1076179 RepID=A0A644ZHR0_9ZZZZ